VTVDLAPDRSEKLRLRHPVLVAAGGAGFGAELLDAVGDLLPGAIVTRSTTRTNRNGPPAPRMETLQYGLLTSIGFPDAALDSVVRRHGPRWASTDVPVVVSIHAETVEDIAWLVRRLDTLPGVAGVELDLAGPAGGRGGPPIGLDLEASELATVAARAATDLPLIVKLPLADGTDVARAVAAAGADAISAIGPVPALALEGSRARSALGSSHAGLSGPAIKPMALRTVHEMAQVVRIPIVGIGGVSNLDDVLDFLAAGASAVGVATAALADPELPGSLGRELQQWCAREGVTDVHQLIGTALPRRRQRATRRAAADLRQA
jgi:dihydroorotate dehydrogenase (NAD+) catalytic subunit